MMRIAPKGAAMKYTKLSSTLFLLLVLSACGTPQYTPPEPNQPHAVLKLKFKYSAVSPNTTLGARMLIRHDAESDSDTFMSAYDQSFGPVSGKDKLLEIPMASVNIIPGKKTDVMMAVYFFWYTTQTYTVMVNNVPQVRTSQVYNETACNVKISFTPEQGKVYLLDYNSPNINRDCSGHAYQQVSHGGDKFTLNKVGTSKVQ